MSTRLDTRDDTRGGFSLLELLLSSAILALMVGAIVSFALLAEFTGRRAETIAEVERMEETLGRITRAVETADIIAAPPLSPANARAGASLVLANAVTRAQTVFQLRDGRIQLVEIADGGAPPLHGAQELLGPSLDLENQIC